MLSRLELPGLPELFCLSELPGLFGFALPGLPRLFCMPGLPWLSGIGLPGLPGFTGVYQATKGDPGRQGIWGYVGLPGPTWGYQALKNKTVRQSFVYPTSIGTLQRSLRFGYQQKEQPSPKTFLYIISEQLL